MATKKDGKSFAPSSFGDRDHVLFTYINQWEKHSIAKIQQAAEQARLDLKELLAARSEYLFASINQLNKKMASPGTDPTAEVWTRQLIELKQQVADMSAQTQLEHDRRKSPISLIQVKNAENNPKTNPSYLVTRTSFDHFVDTITMSDGDLICVPGTAPITQRELQKAEPKLRKQMLGERLFLLVQQIEPRLAAKITGMFLEWDIQYILMLLHSADLLESKV